MPLLRLTQHIENEDQYRVEIAFEDDDGSRQTTDVSLPYQFTEEDRADMLVSERLPAISPRPGAADPSVG